MYPCSSMRIRLRAGGLAGDGPFRSQGCADRGLYCRCYLKQGMIHQKQSVQG